MLLLCLCADPCVVVFAVVVVAAFSSARSFQQDVSSWDTSKVTYLGFSKSAAVCCVVLLLCLCADPCVVVVAVVVVAAFYYASRFNQDISSWDVSTRSMLGMLLGADFFNQTGATTSGVGADTNHFKTVGFLTTVLVFSVA